VKLVSLQVGKPSPHADGFTTGYGKRAAKGPVRVSRTNLDGDGQADVRFHGGPEMAVLAYAAAHYPAWRAQLDWPDLACGAFAENFTVEGAAEDDACLGDVWRVGSAVLQIASPRKPCRVISRYWRKPELLRLVEQSGRFGWYLRVREEGFVEAGDSIALLDRPHPEWTVARAMQVARARKRDAAAAEELAAVAALSDRWKAFLRGDEKV
jgi:MOSC domain-containing protein YiiM